MTFCSYNKKISLLKEIFFSKIILHFFFQNWLYNSGSGSKLGQNTGYGYKFNVFESTTLGRYRHIKVRRLADQNEQTKIFFFLLKVVVNLSINLCNMSNIMKKVNRQNLSHKNQFYKMWRNDKNKQTTFVLTENSEVYFPIMNHVNKDGKSNIWKLLLIKTAKLIYLRSSASVCHWQWR